ncbi:hypothetical protein SERLA73DRAFT_162575 [Serpula lacrymans var. lacrymans S7.3]|uniref:Conserved oligomeric Golgi complex subunit 6 n=2 Tax=Serpula lacrymans var. lacrymans TaxID=341189 RepID=F8Q8J6_SERL3|nr:uncharacterized protein SERLADRAFT_452516 [Serpula lacrymans var. lacrymans S7.9]EGN95884.1 hypothetical protein SERLA73DRAFT_162575 [Serpula lacrymans var. lacrymans S7.3]EGO21397.1 hypothetical protein SERLADRAFT_452516 [Serpula lacrymans var. lacrymans S7.9]
MSIPSPQLTPVKTSASPSPFPSTNPRNPVALRLRKILGTNFTDEATKDALKTLSELYGVPSQSNGRNEKQVTLESDDEDSSDNERIDSVNLDSLTCETASRARKHLRRDLENKLGEGSHKFLTAFAEVDRKLDELQTHVSTMRVCCDDAEAQLLLTSTASKSLLDRAESLRDERNEVESRKSIITLFLSRFTLTRSEIDALTARDVPVGPTFFAAMSKAEHVRRDCRVLMVGEDGPTKAGLDIMSTTSSYLEQAYDKISRWCTFEFREIGREPHFEASPAMREAIRRLKVRAELLSETLPTLAHARSQTLLAAFTNALTRGSSSSSIVPSQVKQSEKSMDFTGTRPIELHAHDPLRYVGDMLAWVHQAVAAEREGMEGLFGIGEGEEGNYDDIDDEMGDYDTETESGGEGVDDDGDSEVEDRKNRRVEERARSSNVRRGRMVGAPRVFGSTDEDGWVGALVDGAIGGLCVPLRARITQTIQAQDQSPLTSYKLANLMSYYALTMARVVGKGAIVVKVLYALTEMGYKVFFDGIEAQGRALLRIPLDLDDPDVSPPLPILEHAQRLREIMNVYDSSLLGDGDPVLDDEDVSETERSGSESGPGEKSATSANSTIFSVVPSKRNSNHYTSIQRILDVMLDPAVSMCLGAAAEKKRVRPRWDDGVFGLNCLDYIQTLLEPFAFTVDKQGELQDMIDERVQALTDEHYENVLKDAGLHDAVVACETCSSNDPLSHIPATQPSELVTTLARFSQWLSGLEVVQSPRLARLSQQRLHDAIHHAALARLARSYERLCTMIRDVKSRYEAPGTLLGSERPFGQVALLWQIFGLEEEDWREDEIESEGP